MVSLGGVDVDGRGIINGFGLTCFDNKLALLVTKEWDMTSSGGGGDSSAWWVDRHTDRQTTKSINKGVN